MCPACLSLSAFDVHTINAFHSECVSEREGQIECVSITITHLSSASVWLRSMGLAHMMLLLAGCSAAD